MCFDALALKAIKEQCRENRERGEVCVGFDPAKPGSERTVIYKPAPVREISFELKIELGEGDDKALG